MQCIIQIIHLPKLERFKANSLSYHLSQGNMYRSQLLRDCVILGWATLADLGLREGTTTTNIQTFIFIHVAVE